MITIPFQENKVAQMSLSQVGGTIFIDPNGKVLFSFKNKRQYDKYLELINRDRKTD